jgi:CBS domain-containing protein
MMTVKDGMSNHPISVLRSTSFGEIAARLREFRMSGFPVVDDDGMVLGVVSEADLLLKETMDGGYDGVRGMLSGALHRTELHKAAGLTAEDLMTSPAVTISPDDPVEHAARVMYIRGFKRLPVTDEFRRLIGIISRTDVLAAFDRPDTDIRLEVVQHAIPLVAEPSQFQVAVKNGIVTLTGAADTAAIAHELVAKVRQVQGVVAVRDRIVYPLPQVPASPGPYF